MSAGEREPIRIGFAVEGDISPAAWSGTYAGLAGGLRVHGAEIVPVDITTPKAVERVLFRLPGWRVHTALRHAAMRMRVSRAGAIDVLLMVGSRARVTIDVPQATYEDMTVRQALAVGDPWVSERPAAELRAWQRRQGAAYRAAGRVFAMSEWAARSIISDYDTPAQRVRIVGAGVNQVIAPVQRDWTTPRFLFIGRDFERKNGPAVLAAFRTLRSECPEATLDVVGDHPPIEIEGVVGHGPLTLGDEAGRAAIERLLARATCFVMPSRYEPFGIVYAEAAMAGVASIATTVGGTFVDAGCGARVAPDDPSALLDAMRRLSDGATARRLGEEARRRAEPFTWPDVGGRMLRGFSELLGRPVDGLPEYL